MIKVTELEYKEKIGAWHTEWEIKVEGSYGSIQIKGMLTGCSLMQVAGFYYPLSYPYLTDKTSSICKELIDVFNKHKDILIEDGVGCLVATIGTSYPNKYVYEFLEKTGFVEAVEFYNNRHNNGDTQKVYMCILPKKK